MGARRPAEHIKAACRASLKALGPTGSTSTSTTGPTPTVPYAETIGAFKELRDEGKVRWIGISNASVEQIEEACAIADIAAVQEIQLARSTRRRSKGGGAVRGARDRVPAVVAAGRDPRADCRRRPPARAGGGRGAAAYRRSRSRSWLLALSPVVIPIPGASRQVDQDSVRAVELELTPDELEAIGWGMSSSPRTATTR